MSRMVKNREIRLAEPPSQPFRPAYPEPTNKTVRHKPKHQRAPHKRIWNGRLIRNAVALMTSSGGTGMLGIVFWATAAHLASPNQVGRASSEIAAMVLLAQLAQMSFTSIFDRFLPVTGNRTRKFVTQAYALCSLVALVVAVGYLGLGFGGAYIPAELVWRALFVVSVVCWTIFVLQDSVLTGLRATHWVPVENILFAVAKIVLLPVFLVFTTSQGLFLAWTVPVVVAIAAVSGFLFRRHIPRHEGLNPASENYPTRRVLFRLGAGQYAVTLITMLSPSIVALIVINRLGSVAEAQYYLPALISTGGVGLLMLNLVTSFLVEASHEPQELIQHAKITVRAGIILLGPMIVVGVAFAPEILRIFGPTYAENGTLLLRLLLLSLPGAAVAAFNFSLAWIEKRMLAIAIANIASAAIYFSLILLLIDRYGIVSIGIAAVVLAWCQVAFFVPMAMRRFRIITQSSSSLSEIPHTVPQ